MLSLYVIPPGSDVLIADGDIKATVVDVTIGSQNAITYGVAWWKHGVRRTADLNWEETRRKR